MMIAKYLVFGTLALLFLVTIGNRLVFLMYCARRQAQPVPSSMAPRQMVSPTQNAIFRGMVEDGDISMAMEYLEAGADPNSGDPMFGETPLMDAAVRCDVEMVRLLLSKGASINLKDDVGMTALDHVLNDSNPRPLHEKQAVETVLRSAGAISTTSSDRERARESKWTVMNHVSMAFYVGDIDYRQSALEMQGRFGSLPDAYYDLCEKPEGERTPSEQYFVRHYKEMIQSMKSGHVMLKHLGLPDADNLLAQAELALHIRRAIKARGLTPSQASLLLGIDPAEVSSIVNGRLGDYSTDRLMKFLNDLGCDVEISVSAPHPEGSGHVLIA